MALHLLFWKPKALYLLLSKAITLHFAILINKSSLFAILKGHNFSFCYSEKNNSSLFAILKGHNSSFCYSEKKNVFLLFSKAITFHFAILKNKSPLLFWKNKSSLFTHLKSHSSSFTVLKSHSSSFAIPKSNSSLFAILKSCSSSFAVPNSHSSVSTRYSYCLSLRKLPSPTLPLISPSATRVIPEMSLFRCSDIGQRFG